MENSPLADRFGRKIEYLRLSVTDRCDLRCNYCIPPGFKHFEKTSTWLDFDEITRLVEVFSRLGINRIRLTGGEPLTRHGITELAQRLHAVAGISDLSLSTNATRLDHYAEDLRQAGISRINVSLDSLQHEVVTQITGRDCLDEIIAGLMAGKRAGFSPIKVNMVVMQGINDEEIDEMTAFCLQEGFILRLIETMPMGISGQKSRFHDLQPVKKRLRQRFGLVDGVLPGGGPARYLQTPDGTFSVGFITPLTQHFCDTCNRVRLSVDGTLYLCLGQDDKVELRPLLRRGAGNDELAAVVRQAIAQKPERHTFREKPQKIVRIMAKTGG